MVTTVKLAAAFNGLQISRFLDDADQRVVSLIVRAEAYSDGGASGYARRRRVD